MSYADILILAGAMIGGFVSGLTGFGTALTALPFWLYAVPPVLAAPLVIVCSFVSQIQTLPAIRHTVDWHRTIPFVLGGIVGVPAGTLILNHVSAYHFKLLIGWLLIFYCLFMLARKSSPGVIWGGRMADGIVGLVGGVLGGLAGLSGVLPAMWATLRGWTKTTKRSVFQIFNLSVIIFAFLSQWISGLMTLELGKLALIALPGTIFGAWLGRKTYHRIADDRFNHAVLLLLLVSGVSLLVTSFFNR